LNPGAANASNRSTGAIVPSLFPSKEIDMQDSNKKMPLAALGLLIGTALLAGPAAAQTQAPSSTYSTSPSPSSQPTRQVQARVTSVNQVTDSNGGTAYNVTYQYEGRSYSMRTATYPGPTVPVEVNAYGVATLPVGEPAGSNTVTSTDAVDDRSPWDRVVPEQGVVVSAGAAPAQTAYYAAPGYVAVPPVYVAPPVYVHPGYGYGYGGYGYGYGSPFYSPIGLSLNLGYSRGWGGGHRHGGWRR
jgi:hypothetical protein